MATEVHTVTQDDRPSVYREGDKWVYRVSSLGRCVRALAAARQDYEPLPVLQRMKDLADRGTALEPAIVAWLKLQGLEIEARQLEFEVPLPSALIRGHLDAISKVVIPNGFTTTNGVHLPPGTRAVTEIKTMGQSVFDTWTSKRFEDNYFYPYKVQFALQMYALNLPGLYVVMNRDSNRGRDKGPEIYTYFFAETPMPVAEILQRVIDVEFASRDGKLPLCDRRDFPCRYSYMCDHGEEKELDVTSLDELSILAWVKKYQEASAAQKEADGQLKLCREKLLQFCNYSPTSFPSPKFQSVSVEVRHVRLSVYETERATVDHKALVAHLKVPDDVMKEFTVHSRYPSIRITDRSKPRGEKDA